MNFDAFLLELGTIKTAEIPFYYKNQFKIKDNFINPNSRHFETISQKLLAEERQGLKRKWDKQCKMMFIWILVKFFQLKNKKTINPTKDEWVYLSTALNIDEQILKQRWITLINPMSKSVQWDPEEDEIIRRLMDQQDEKHIWTAIAIELYNYNNGQFVRTPKQVRERWMNYLNPKLRKENWSNEEDQQLLDLVVKHGKRWSHISTLLEGRTENHVKNRFKSLIHKIYKDEEDDDIEEMQAIKEFLQKTQEPTKQDTYDKPKRHSLSRHVREPVKEEYQQDKIKKPKIKEQAPQVQVAINEFPEPEIKVTQEPQFVNMPSNFIDTRSLETRKESTPVSLASQCKSQINVDEDMKNEQYRFYLNQYQKQAQTPISPYNRFEGFKPYAPEDTPVQRLKKYQSMLYMQTPMVQTPMYFINPQYFTQSPQQFIRSPYGEISPQIQLMNYEQIQQEEPQQNVQLEFLQSANLVDKWKQKRDSQKQKQE